MRLEAWFVRRLWMGFSMPSGLRSPHPWRRKDLISNSALPGPRSRLCHCWVRHGDRPLGHRVAAGRASLTALMASQRSQRRRTADSSEQPSEQPRAQTQGYRRGRCRGEMSRLAPVNEPPSPRRSLMAVMAEKPSGDTTIRPFTIDIPQADLEDLRARIAAPRWPSKELVTDRSQGVQLATLQELTGYWTTDYDWRKC